MRRRQPPARPAVPSCVCLVERRGRFLLAKELFPPREEDGFRRRPLSFAFPRGRAAAAAGEIVEVVLDGRGQPKIGRRLGRADHLGELLGALLVARGARLPFGEELDQEIARTARVASADRDRVDLRPLPTFTVDPADAKDHDDAISAAAEGEAVRVWVHIADVSAFVPPGGGVDREAIDRATSLYLPGTVEPMLPPLLSTDLCSLREGVDRLCVTVELVVEEAGVREAAFYRSVIRSDARLTYEQVDRFFAQAARPPAGLGEPLEAARRAANYLLEARRRKGALELESFEPEIKIGRRAITVRLRRSGGASAELDARGLIEQLMVAANEAVAHRVLAARVPALYRVHPRPDPDRVGFLRDQLHSLDFPTVPLPKRMGGDQAAEAVAELAGAAYRHLASLERRGRGAALRLAISSLILRSLKQAYYSPRNLGHAALASAAYCHFTSPIRRYPDLVVHRALLSTIGAAPPPRAAELGALGEWTSQREREVMELEREGDDIAAAFVVAKRIEEEGEVGPLVGQVVGLSEGAVFVAFGLDEEELPPFEGMVPLRALREAGGRRRAGRYLLHPLQTAVYDQDGRVVVRLGDELPVEIARVEPERGRILLWPARGRPRR